MRIPIPKGGRGLLVVAIAIAGAAMWVVGILEESIGALLQ